MRGSSSVTTAKDVSAGISAGSLSHARELADSSKRRRQVPVRASFVRKDEPAVVPPLARLLHTGGRGGGVPIKLYMSLIWRCSASPFNTEISARKWAMLLDLPDPNGLGARRVTTALEVLSRESLVSLDKRRGDSTRVTLREESGDDLAYTLPSTAHTKAVGKAAKQRHLYFKVPFEIWTNGHLQQMSAPAVAMLLILLAEKKADDKPTWWSTERFPDRFNVAESARTKGTKELVARDLLYVGRKSVSISRNPTRTFVKERVRNTYALIGDARSAEPEAD